jgi:nitroreductase
MSEPSLDQLNLFLDRRSIRKFSSRSVRDVDVHRIVEAGKRAPTACNFQTYSVVWIRDAKLKKKMYDSCGRFDSIMEAPIVLAICADVHRLSKVLDYLGSDHCFKHDQGYFFKLLSIMDACFLAENMTMAAESLGLGSVYIGLAFANDEVIKALNLPKGVLPLTLLCIGYPGEKPPTRPRWPLSSVLLIDSYRDPTEEEVKSFLQHTDKELEKERYYEKYVSAKRGSTCTHSKDIQRITSFKSARRTDAKMVRVLTETGFFYKKSENSA